MKKYWYENIDQSVSNDCTPWYIIDICWLLKTPHYLITSSPPISDINNPLISVAEFCYWWDLPFKYFIFCFTLYNVSSEYFQFHCFTD